MRRRLEGVRRFQRFTNDWPWRWRPVDLEEFTAQLRGGTCQSEVLNLTWPPSNRVKLKPTCPPVNWRYRS